MYVRNVESHVKINSYYYCSVILRSLPVCFE